MSKNITGRLGKNIAAARKSVGKTQAEIAEKAAIDTVSLSRIERGIAAPNVLTLSRIADALDTQLWKLFDGTSPNTASLADQIASMLEPLDEKNRLFLLNQIQTLAKWLNRISP